MLHRTILTAASVVALTAAANAADVATYTGYRSYAAGPTYGTINWGGLYGGVNAGYGHGTSKTSIADAESYVYGPITIGNTTYSGGGPGSATQSKTFDSSGVIGGAQIGYNIQIGRVVFGVEGDLQALNVFQERTQTPSILRSEARLLLPSQAPPREKAHLTI